MFPSTFTSDRIRLAMICEIDDPGTEATASQFAKDDGETTSIDVSFEIAKRLSNPAFSEEIAFANCDEFVAKSYKTC